VEQQSSHSLLVGTENGSATLEYSSVVSFKTKDILTHVIQLLHPWYLPKGLENMSTQKPCMDVYSNFIHKSQEFWKHLISPLVMKYFS
jgi:hypothetical protein